MNLNSKILISGSGGYIGSQLKYLISQKNIVTIGSNKNNKIKFNFSNKVEKKIPIIRNIDIFIHLELRNETYFKKNPYLSFDENLNSIKNAILICKKNKIKKFIYLSTIHLYDKNQKIIYEDSKVNCDNFYELSHFTNEQIINLNFTNSQTIYKIFRLANIFGRPFNSLKRKSLVTNSFINSALIKNKIIIKSNGNQIRNFVSSNTLLKLILSEKFKNKIINLVSNNNMSIKNLATIIKKLIYANLNKKIKVIYETNDFDNNDKVKKYCTKYLFKETYSLDKYLFDIIKISND